MVVPAFDTMLYLVDDESGSIGLLMKLPRVESSGTGQCGSLVMLFQLTKSPSTTVNGWPDGVPSMSGVNTAGLRSILIDQSGIAAPPFVSKYCYKKPDDSRERIRLRSEYSCS